ncbi:DUF427 domain-containing protein [Jatrophihabitans sp.]|uniref:DUF427 domain-containing protein n=1 Tax=Jatrophihabitans sp. TaxID=1932789 RepID=UPI0030C68824|nr:hypothetical protein [Jatrophihabitans sp.]
MSTYPQILTPVGHVEPVPRRIRAMLAGRFVVDTTKARYVWEIANYPAYYLPAADIDPAVLAGLHVKHGGGELAGYVRIRWTALDAWFEEDEQVFVHPRDPYTRVDALRSTRRVRVELDGVVLAESSSAVLVFETGLPTRHYLNRTDLNYDHLAPSGTVTECPYKGTTSAYWNAVINGTEHRDIAWAYDFPTRQLLPIAGLVAFYDEKVDTFLDGQLLERPVTKFS